MTEEDYKSVQSPQGDNFEISVAVTSTKDETKGPKEEPMPQLDKSMFSMQSIRIHLDWKSLKVILEHMIVKIFAAVLISLPVFVVIYLISLLPFNDETDDIIHLDNRWSFAALSIINFEAALVIFNILQFIAVFGMKQFISSKHWLFCLIAAVFSSASCVGLTLTNFPYWFYYIDVFVLVITYVICTFSYGWHAPRDVIGAKNPFWNAVQFTLTEVIVAAVSLVYGMWLMPVYASFPPYGQILWRIFVHPIYFDLLVLTPVRILLEVWSAGVYRPLNSLVLAHAQVHIITMGTFMVSELSSVKDAVITMIGIVLFNVTWRSLGLSRIHLTKYVLNRIGCISRVNLNSEQRSKKLEKRTKWFEGLTVSTGIAAELYTTELLMESVLEIASTLYATFSFTMLLPTVNFYYIHVKPGKLPSGVEFFAISLIQFVMTVLGDVIFFWFNYSNLQMLPLNGTIQKMKKNKWSFIGFLAFGMLSMGFICNLYFIFQAPRAVVCASPDKKTCFMGMSMNK